MRIRRKLIACAVASLALAASGSSAVASANPTGPSTGSAVPVGGPNFTGIYLSTWGTSHVTFGDAFKSWLAQTGATMTAQPPVTLDADGGGFTMPVSGPASDRLDAWGRMVYPGGLTISLAAKTREAAVDVKRRTLQLGPMFIRVVPDVSWSAEFAVSGGTDVNEVELATADYPEVLAGGGTPSPSGFRATRLPFRLSQDAADVLASVSGRAAPVAGSLFGTMTPSFDHVPSAN